MLSVILAGCQSQEGMSVSTEPDNPRSDSVTGSTKRTPAAAGTGVSGHLRNPSGAGIGLATITVAPHPAGGEGPVSQQANVSDAEGHYFYPLPPGRWEVTVSAHGYRPVSSLVAVDDGDPAIHNLVLERLKSGRDDEGADETG